MKNSFLTIHRILLLLMCVNFTIEFSGANFHYNSYGPHGINNARTHNRNPTPQQQQPHDLNKKNNKQPLIKTMDQNNYSQGKYNIKNKRSSLYYNFNNNHNPHPQKLMESNYPKYTFMNKPAQMPNPTRLRYQSSHRSTYTTKNKHTQLPLLKNRRRFYFLRSKEEKSKQVKQAKHIGQTRDITKHLAPTPLDN